MSSGRNREEDLSAVKGTDAGTSRAAQWVLKNWKVIAGACVLVAVVAVARDLPITQWLEAMSGWIRSLGWLGVAAYALLQTCAALLCIPCMPLTIAAGFILGTTKGVVAVHTGTCVAAGIGFLIGRKAGRVRLAEWMRRSERFRFIDDAIRREGWKIVGLLRMHALPFGLSNYIYGMTSVPFWHYFAATAIAMLPGNIVFVHLGAIGNRKLSGEGGMHPLEYVLIGLGIVSLIAMGKLVKRLVRTHREGKREGALGNQTDVT